MPSSLRGRLRVAAFGLATVLADGCDFGPVEPGEPFSPGVYHVHVQADDDCGQITAMPPPALDCRGGLWTEPGDGEHPGLVAFWPEVDGATYVINDGVLTEVNSAPVLRWSGSDREFPEACPMAERRWVTTVTNDGAGLINGSLRNTWSNVATCPIGSGTPQTDCTTQFTYRYELETACDSPCELIDADEEPAAGEPYDCGASVCSCP